MPAERDVAERHLSDSPFTGLDPRPQTDRQGVVGFGAHNPGRASRGVGNSPERHGAGEECRPDDSQHAHLRGGRSDRCTSRNPRGGGADNCPQRSHHQRSPFPDRIPAGRPQIVVVACVVGGPSHGPGARTWRNVDRVLSDRAHDRDHRPGLPADPSLYDQPAPPRAGACPVVVATNTDVPGWQGDPGQLGPGRSRACRTRRGCCGGSREQLGSAL